MKKTLIKKMATRSKEKAKARQKAKDMRPTAHARYIRISPFKVRAVIDIVRGKPVTQAIAILANTPKSASEPVLKLINSATANAEHNLGHSRADLFIAEIHADPGPVLKRIVPRARGSASRIVKRTSHITVKLDVIKEAK